MKLIVGLGNPGEKYNRTRHNIGFSVVEHFLRDFETFAKTVWQDAKDVKSDIAELEWQPARGAGERVVLAKPKTYMNNSGIAVLLLAKKYNIEPEDIWIVHDELDLPLGTLKIRQGGSSAGHKGVESIMQKLGTEKFWRFRLGIGQVHNHKELARSIMHNVDDYVLSEFDHKQTGDARRLVKKAVQALEISLEKGLLKAQNRFN